jgi:hypothetical protein
MTKPTYRSPEHVTDREAMDAIARNDVERLRTLPIDLGFNHENWRFIQDVCVKLSEHEDPWIRSNSFLGLSYAARFRGRVEKNIVKPILLRGLKDEDRRVAAVAEDAIEEINHLMGWHIGGAKGQKERETRYEEKRAKQRES